LDDGRSRDRGVRGRVAWAHDYDTDRSIGTTFVLVVNGAAPGKGLVRYQW
jgi:hypothetical protein